MRIDIIGAIVPNDDAWIYDWFEMDCTCPKTVNDVLSQANGEQVDVYIDSGGGDVFAGSNIYSALRSYAGKVKIHVVGLAASAASVIACAGESDISPTAMMMVHNVSCLSSGDYHQMDKTSGVLKTADRAIAAAYTEKTGKSEEEMLALMDKETWLTASDAVESGLIDRISGDGNMQLVASVSNIIPKEVIEKIRNTVRNPDCQNNLDFLCAKLKLLKMKGGN